MNNLNIVYRMDLKFFGLHEILLRRRYRTQFNFYECHFARRTLTSQVVLDEHNPTNHWGTPRLVFPLFISCVYCLCISFPIHISSTLHHLKHQVSWRFHMCNIFSNNFFFFLTLHIILYVHFNQSPFILPTTKLGHFFGLHPINYMIYIIKHVIPFFKSINH